MEPMRELGRMLIFAGAALAAIGALVWLAGRPGGFPLRLGRCRATSRFRASTARSIFPC